jgi:hypothetical protein
MISSRDSSRLTLSHIYPPTPPNPALQCPDDHIPTSTMSMAGYFTAKMRAYQQVAVTAERAPILIPIPVSVPIPILVSVSILKSDSEAQDVREGTTPVDGFVTAGRDKDNKQKRKIRERERMPLKWRRCMVFVLKCMQRAKRGRGRTQAKNGMKRQNVQCIYVVPVQYLLTIFSLQFLYLQSIPVAPSNNP